MGTAFADRVIALAEGRQLEELVRLLDAEGATSYRCPLVSILDPADDAPALAWIEQWIQGRFDLIILLTGEGLRRLLACADRHGIKTELIAAIAQSRTVTRGPKPVQALKEIGLGPSLVARTPTTEGVIQALGSEDLFGKAVGVQLYREDNPPLVEFLTKAGATVHSVQPYVYAPASDADKVVELIDRLAEGKVDVTVFTSAPQVERLFEVAEERGLESKLREGLAKTRVAAVGPVLADNLKAKSVRVDICPEQGFQMKNLVLHIKRAFAG